MGRLELVMTDAAAAAIPHEPVLRPPFPSSSHIVPLDWRNREHRDAAARLTVELLPVSPAAILGHDYLANFHFFHLVRDGLIKCDLYQWDGKIVAFVAYTTQPFTFIQKGLRRHFVALAYRLGKSVLVRPRRLLSILDVMKQGEWRSRTTLDPRLGEMLSLGVQDAYRRIVDPETRSKIAYALLGNALNDLQRAGSPAVLFVVVKGNERALSIYYKLGAIKHDASYCSDTSEILTIPLA
jgi:ribosomal protein S18 acetylase RimI-like enzyme